MIFENALKNPHKSFFKMISGIRAILFLYRFRQVLKFNSQDYTPSPFPKGKIIKEQGSKQEASDYSMQRNKNEEQKQLFFHLYRIILQAVHRRLKYFNSSYLEKLWYGQQSRTSVQNSVPGYSASSLFEQLPGNSLPFFWCSMLVLYLDRSVNLTL